MNNEQWKSGGDCEQCRRRNYCSKECTEHKKMLNELIATAFTKYMFNKLAKKGVIDE